MRAAAATYAALVVLAVVWDAVAPLPADAEAARVLADLDPWAALAVMVLGAVVEEVAIRAALWRLLRPLSAVSRVGVSAIAFGGLHAVSDPLHGLYATAAGVVLGIARERAGFAPTTAAHVAINATAWALS